MNQSNLNLVEKCSIEHIQKFQCKFKLKFRKIIFQEYSWVWMPESALKIAGK